MLYQNYPNPFNPVTTIRFGVPKAGEVKIEVYNILGQKVAELLNRKMEPGYHEVRFDDARLGSGIYIYRMQAEKFQAVRKLLLVK
ncbi:MAG: hypothetical protein Kow0037_15150 [Calditrichia bacterium]